MAKHATPAPQVIDTPMSEDALQQDVRAANELASLVLAQQASAVALAHDLGYQGSLTVGALEDEIRFYQQRSVEAMLEAGKRLLLLKEVTPHGEFEQRVEMLGFSVQSARRFMSAARKTAKSLTVSVLAGQVKNQKAFLELITHDDDVIEELAELDDFDRMSASQLRAKARELVADMEATEKVLATKNRLIDEKQRELMLSKSLKLAPTDWPERFKGLMDQVDLAHKSIKLCIDSLEAVRVAAMEDEAASEEEEGSLQRARETLAEHMLRTQRSCAERLDALGGIFDKTLGAFASEGVWK